MAIYYMSLIKNGSRGNGQNAVAAAAYRSGEKLKSEEAGRSFSYARKERVVFSEVFLPANAPTRFSNREMLWNEVHKVEKSKDARLWRGFEVAIPKELNRNQQIELICNFAKIFTDERMVADVNIHDEGDGNPHAHFMLTTRPILENGAWGSKEKKVYSLDEHGERIQLIDKNTGKQKVDGRNRKQWKREYVQINPFNQKEKVSEWRAAWAAECNSILRKSGIGTIDHRSYAERGIERLPTVHIGYGKDAPDRRELNALISERNAATETINGLKYDIAELEAEERRREEAERRRQAERFERERKWESESRPTVKELMEFQEHAGKFVTENLLEDNEAAPVPTAVRHGYDAR